MKQIYLIRHGQSAHNSSGNLLSGISDIPLTPIGIEECKYLSAFFKGIDIKKVYTSPLKRAIESAENIFQDHGNYEIAHSLIEFNYGDYEGYDQNSNLDDEIIKQWNNLPKNLTFPNGGNIQSHAKNALDGFFELIKNTKESTIACISHKTTIRLIFAQILKMDLNNFRLISCDNCAISKLHFHHDHFELVSQNVTLEFLKSKAAK